MPTSLKAASALSYCAAVCLLLSGLAILGAVGAEHQHIPTWENSMDPNNETQLEMLWEGRRAARPGG